MSKEQPYQPSEEDVKKAEEMMTEKQKEVSEKRELQFKLGKLPKKRLFNSDIKDAENTMTKDEKRMSKERMEEVEEELINIFVKYLISFDEGIFSRYNEYPRDIANRIKEKALKRFEQWESYRTPSVP